MLMGKTHILWGTFEKSLPCEHCLAGHARDTVVPRETIVQGVRGDIDRVLVGSHDNIGMDCGLEGVVLFLVVKGLGLVIWISKPILMAILDVLEWKVWRSDVLEIIGARVGSDVGSTGENKGSGVNIHRRLCVRERGRGRSRRVRRGRSWWMVTVNGREGVLNKWYIAGIGTGEESVTTSNSYIIIAKDKGKKKTGVDFGRLSAVQVPRGTATKGEEVKRHKSELEIKSKNRTPLPAASHPGQSRGQTTSGSTDDPCERSARMDPSPAVFHHTDNKSVASIFHRSSVTRESQADRGKQTKGMTYMITPHRLFRVHSTSWTGHRRFVQPLLVRPIFFELSHQVPQVPLSVSSFQHRPLLGSFFQPRVLEYKLLGKREGAISVWSVPLELKLNVCTLNYFRTVDIPCSPAIRTK